MIEEELQPDGCYKTFVTLGLTRRPARNLDQAKQLADGYKQEIKETEGPYGGYMKHPPISCKHKVKDKDAYWVESVICAHHCSDTFCKTYITLMEGGKQRRKLQDTEKLQSTCPFCQCQVQEVSDDFIITTYVCGSFGNRLTKEYNKKCCQPQTTRRTRR